MIAAPSVLMIDCTCAHVSFVESYREMACAVPTDDKSASNIIGNLRLLFFVWTIRLFTRFAHFTRLAPVSPARSFNMRFEIIWVANYVCATASRQNFGRAALCHR